MHNKIRVSDVLIMTTPFKEIPLRFRPFIFTVYVLATAALAMLSASTSRAQTNWTRDVGHGHTSAGTAGGGNWDTTIANAVWLNQLDISSASQGWGDPLIIGGKTFERGFGTHADSILHVNLGGDAQSFSASVGVDDEVRNPAASVEFFVIGDGSELWNSGVMHAGDAPKECAVNLSGVKTLILKVGDADGQRDRWQCSDKQRDLITKITEEHHLDKNAVVQLAQDRFGKSVKSLNKLEASGLIDELLEQTGQKNGNQGRRFNGSSTSARVA